MHKKILAAGHRLDPLRTLKHSSRPPSCCGCGRRQRSFRLLAAIRGCFCLGGRKGKWKGTEMIGESRREGTGKCIYNYHCQRLHVQFIMHKTRSSIKTLKQCAIREGRISQTSSRSYVRLAVGEGREGGRTGIGKGNWKEG